MDERGDGKEGWKKERGRGGARGEKGEETEIGWKRKRDRNFRAWMYSTAVQPFGYVSKIILRLEFRMIRRRPRHFST